ncbi:MAG: hypothetical protein ACOYXM_16715 [Actinomycetota bacterium]
MPRKPVFHVVVLTGNERQAKRAGAIQALVTAESPHPIRVELIAPAWTPNWGRVLAEFRRALRNADAAVIGTYIPTELGHAARAEVRRLDVPYISSDALGQHGIANAVLAAVAHTGKAA